MPTINSPPHMTLARLFAILLILLLVVLSFAWSAGWIGKERLTAQRLINTIEANGQVHPGLRRAHTKGVCVAGHFESNGIAKEFSTARVFTQASVPVLGRLSLGGNNPHAADATARVRGLALRFTTDDGQEWRTAMNSFPFFPVATPQGVLAQAKASKPDPATGKPDPQALAEFVRLYPEAKKFQEWAKSAPWSNSWANTTYNGANSFRLINVNGDENFVRWSLRPRATFQELDATQRQQADTDFLSQDLKARLEKGPLLWDLVLTFATAGDPVDDPSQPWPVERKQVIAGTLVLVQAEPDTEGACRDINYDPLILPSGIQASNDPILAARSAAYSQSFNRREYEIGIGNAGKK